MIRIYVVTDLCEHRGSDKELNIRGADVEIVCRECGRGERVPMKSLWMREVGPGACLRMVGIDFKPYVQSKPSVEVVRDPA